MFHFTVFEKEELQGKEQDTSRVVRHWHIHDPGRQCRDGERVVSRNPRLARS
jgi:hypothetical protein